MTYENIEGWFAFAEAYDIIANACSNGDTIVELGVWNGRSTVYMGHKLKSLGKKVNFFAVDSWECAYGTYTRFLRTLSTCELLTEVTPLVMRSVDASALFKDGTLSSVWVDADHSEESVTADIKAWLPKVKPGGIIGGDDYVKGWDGVIAAVDKLLPDRTVKGTWWMKRL